MPTYKFECTNCGYTETSFRSILTPKISKCPSCEQQTLYKLIGVGGGVKWGGKDYVKKGWSKTWNLGKNEVNEKKPKKRPKSGQGGTQ